MVSDTGNPVLSERGEIDGSRKVPLISVFYFIGKDPVYGIQLFYRGAPKTGY